MFNDALQPVLYELKAAIAKESFEQKGKFPPSLKPMLTKVALQAIHCGEYSDNFFSHAEAFRIQQVHNDRKFY